MEIKMFIAKERYTMASPLDRGPWRVLAGEAFI
jgi:hypothetical protein